MTAVRYPSQVSVNPSAARHLHPAVNGHIHQVLQKVGGNIIFHSARSTAFPQPAPGQAASPGPMKNVPAEKLKQMLGITHVNYIERQHSLAIIDANLGAGA
jgi:hypothetical protein